MVNGLINIISGLLKFTWGFISLVIGRSNFNRVIAVVLLIFIWGGLTRL